LYVSVDWNILCLLLFIRNLDLKNVEKNSEICLGSTCIVIILCTSRDE
jgi:hypothetical protein